VLPLVFVAAWSASACDRRGLIPPYAFPLAPTGPFAGTAPANPRATSGYFVAADKSSFAVQITWDAVPGAFTYVVEVGDAPGARNLSVTEIAGTSRSFVVRLPLLGTAYVRVKAKAQTEVGPSSAEISFPVADFRDFVEVLFFGTGALGFETGTCPGPTGGIMRGWPRGQQIRVLFGSGVSSDQKLVVQRMVERFRDAASGISVVIQDSPLQDPPAGVNQLVVAAVADDQVEHSCGGAAVDTCFTSLNFAPFQIRYLMKSSVTGHRLGFFTGWAFGLCGVGAPGWSVMSGFQDLPAEFTSPDFQAISAVYGAGLGQGSPRSAFVGAGLIR
jgi:hypothetical protein